MRCYTVPGTCQTPTDVAVIKQHSESPLALVWGREEEWEGVAESEMVDYAFFLTYTWNFYISK